ncbi:MAG: anaerobic ribonucleoside-triphosphate reductase activating protein [Rubrivivax sp.]|nr:anaerobic ribonucleoside-triphosphate reductase activating protein [Rubrivivax sp.]
MAAALRVGGLQPFTSIDYPGALAAVVFVQGCPWRCPFCHNPHLQPRSGAAGGAGPPWPELRAWLQRRARVLDAVVFSGGEPTQDPALPDAMREARALGYRVGLHSAGMSPRRLQAVLPLVDWVGLDVKAPLDDDALHDRMSGVRGAAGAVRDSVRAVVASGVAHECRTTVHAELLAAGALRRMPAQLRALGVRHWALQACREPAERPTHPAAATWPGPALLDELQRAFPGLTLRPAG